MRASTFTLFLKRLKLNTEEAQGWPNYERALERISKTPDLRNPTDQVAEPVSPASALPELRGQAWRQWLVILILIFSDILLALSVWWAATILQSIWGRWTLTEASAASIVPNAVLWIGIRALLGLYPGYGLGQVEVLRRQTYSTFITLAMTAVLALTFQVGDVLSRLLLGLGFLGLLVLAPLLRHFVKRGMNRVGLWGKPVVILGAGKTGAHLARDLQKEWSLGFRPVAVFDDQLAPVGGMLEGVPYRGTLTDAMNLPRKQGIDTAIFAMSHAHCKHLDTFISQASLRFRYVIVIPDPAGVTTSAVVARDLAGTLGVEIKHNLLRPWVLRAKRMLDLSIAIVVVPLILPLLLMISLLVWMDSHGHVFYKAQRMGQDSKLFRCVKFRTMVPDAESALQRILEENAEIREEYLKYHKLRDDPRVTRVGRFLRKTSLDELPQLWNVLRGEMSLVGPRPYLPRESAKIGAAQGEILRVPPGITGLWQVAGRSRTYFNERVQMDTYYVRNWSIWLDFIILARTLGSVVLDGKLSERF